MPFWWVLPRYQKKRTVGAFFSPHPLGHEKKPMPTFGKSRPLWNDHWKLHNKRTFKGLKKNDENPRSLFFRLQAIEIQNGGIWKKLEKNHNSQAFLSPSFFPKKGTGNICIYFRVKRLKMCGLWSVFGVDSKDTRNPNHRAPNQQLTISWDSDRRKKAHKEPHVKSLVSISKSFSSFFSGYVDTTREKKISQLLPSNCLDGNHSFGTCLARG